MSRTPEDWLEDGFELAWPEYIPRKDYQRAIEMVVTLGGALRGIKRPPPLSEGTESQDVAGPGISKQKKHTRYQEVIRGLLENGEFTTGQLSRKTLCHVGTAWSIVKQLKPTPRVVGTSPKGGKIYTLKPAANLLVKPSAKPSRKASRGWNRTVRAKGSAIEALIREKGPISAQDAAKAVGATADYVGQVAKRMGASRQNGDGKTLWYMNGASPA